MLIGYYGLSAVTQCTMASDEFGLACCTTPLDPGCDHGAWPESAYGRYHVAATLAERSYTADELRGQVDQESPVEVYYEWTGGGAHVAVVAGYYENGDFLVHDPWYGSGRRTHQQIESGYGLGAWTMTYETGTA
jgi:hypothetical protein